LTRKLSYGIASSTMPTVPTACGVRPIAAQAGDDRGNSGDDSAVAFSLIEAVSPGRRRYSLLVGSSGSQYMAGTIAGPESS
jgi:hypothetical protein